MEQSSPFQKIEKNLPVCADFARGNDRPMDRLSQASVIDERAFLLRPARARQNVMSEVADRRRQQIVTDNQRHALKCLRLRLLDPSPRPWRITGRQVQRLHSSLGCIVHYPIEGDCLTLEMAQDFLDAATIGTLLSADGEFHR